MFSNCKTALQTSALLALSALALACGGDDSGDTNNGGNGDAGTPATGDGGTPATGELVQYNGTLVSILAIDTSMKIPTPHKIELLNNTTGAPLVPPITTMSAQDTGAISFKGPKGTYMVKITGVGTGPMSTYDAVIVNADSALPDPLLRISSSGTLSLAEGSGGFVSKADRAALGATVYWTPNGRRMGTVGCAKVYLDGSATPDVDQDQRYNGKTGLPGPISCAAGAANCTPITQTLSGGRFYIANIKTGTHKLKVTLDDGANFIGKEVEFVVPYTRAEASSETKSVLVQLGVDIDTPTNPTLATCKDPV